MAGKKKSSVPPHKHQTSNIIGLSSALAAGGKSGDGVLDKGVTAANAFIKKMGGKVTLTKWYLIGLIVVVVMGIASYIRTQMNKLTWNNTNMEEEYIKGNTIGPIKKNQGRFQHNLRDYYIASSYNSCCAGDFQNDYVDLEPLKEVIKQGSRLLDFEIYSVNGKAIVAASPNKSYDIKGTYNSIPINAVLDTVNKYAFSPGFAPNATDPIFLHFRVKSDNTNIYKELTTSVTKNFTTKLLAPQFGYEGRKGKDNLVNVPLLELQNKVIIIAANDSNNFRNTPFEELVNMSTGTPFLNSVRNYEVQYTHDPAGFKTFNKKNMTLTMPDLSALNKNVPASLHQTYGCQFVCMNYANKDTNMIYYLNLFNEAGTAFVLKPANLRYQVVTIPKPPAQNPKLSYAKKTIALPMFKANI